MDCAWERSCGACWRCLRARPQVRGEKETYRLGMLVCAQGLCVWLRECSKAPAKWTIGWYKRTMACFALPGTLALNDHLYIVLSSEIWVGGEAPLPLGKDRCSSPERRARIVYNWYCFPFLARLRGYVPDYVLAMEAFPVCIHKRQTRTSAT